MLSALLMVVMGQMYSMSVPGCYDGDTCTIDVVVPTPFSVDLVVHDSMRLCGINAPELRGETLEAAKASRDYLVSRIRSGKVIQFAPFVKSGRVQRDKYGRLLGWIVVDGITLNTELVQRGYAVVYTIECV